jgi:hypothetical protein
MASGNLSAEPQEAKHHIGVAFAGEAFLVSTQKLFTPSHQMFRHIHRALNVDKKTNYTVYIETARQIF